MKKYIQPLIGFITLQIIFSALSNLALAFLPYFIKLLFDSTKTNDITGILWLCGSYAGCILASLVFTYIDQYFMWRTAIGFEGALKRDFFASVTAYKYSRFRKTDVGEYIAIQGNEIQELETDYLTPLIGIFKSIMSLIVYAVVLFVFIDWRIGIVIVLVSIITALVAPKVLTKPLSRRRKTFLDKKGEYIAKMKDLLEGFKLIKTTTRDAFLTEHEHSLKETLASRFSYGKLKVLMLVVNGAFLYSLNVLSFAIIGLMLYLKEITIGSGVATLGYIESFIDPIRDITMDISAIRSTNDIKAKVLHFLSVEQQEALPQPKKLNYAIELRNVTAAFDDFSLGPVNLRFEQGKKYALIGPNGSGKSTILNLIMGYAEPLSGDLLFDKRPFSELDLSRAIWNVDQHDHIFASDFKNCVTVFSALPIGDLRTLENTAGTQKLNTLASSENCQELSGGEKQLVSIARSMFADTDVVLLDESFSAMDPITREHVHAMILGNKEKTVIAVTHTLSEGLDLYDEVIIMQNGRITAQGPWSVIKTDEALAQAIS